MEVGQALAKAEEAEIDLVEIAPNAAPPVCRLMDYGKFKYNEQKKKQDAKAKQKQIQVKEIKFRPGTDQGDYQIKLRNLQDLKEPELTEKQNEIINWCDLSFTDTFKKRSETLFIKAKILLAQKKKKEALEVLEFCYKNVPYNEDMLFCHNLTYTVDIPLLASNLNFFTLKIYLFHHKYLSVFLFLFLYQ